MAVHGHAGAGLGKDARVLEDVDLGDEADGEEDRVAGDVFPAAGDGALGVVERLHGDALHAASAVDAADLRAEAQGDAEVVEALHLVAHEAAQVGQALEDGLDLASFDGQAARHDEADVARALDDDALAEAVAAKVDEVLGLPGGEDARGPAACDFEVLARALPAAGGDDDRVRADFRIAGFGRNDAEDLVAGDAENHGAERGLDAGGREFRLERAGVLGPRHVLFIPQEAEAGMDALVQDAAQARVAVDEEDAVDAEFL